MPRIVDIQALEARSAAIRDEARELHERLAKLEVEAGEIAVTFRVLARYTAPTKAVGARAPSEPKLQTSCPDVIVNGAENGQTIMVAESKMSVPAMVDSLLGAAVASGKTGLTSNAILEGIRAKWNPDFKSDSLRPRLWRLVGAKRLVKNGAIYSPATLSAENAALVFDWNNDGGKPDATPH